jgi:uncharacterized linocin/CFP29 family protein
MSTAELTFEDWAALDALAKTTVNETARVRPLLTRREVSGAYLVPAPKLQDGDEIAIVVHAAVRPIRIRCAFRIASEQMHDREIHERLVTVAAKRLAMAEDLILTFGGHLQNVDAWQPKGVTLDGLTAETAALVGVLSKKPLPLLDAVRNAIATLQTNAQPSPYALLLMPQLWFESTTLHNTRVGSDVLRDQLGNDGRVAPLPQTWEAPTSSKLERRGVVFARTGAFELMQVSDTAVAKLGEKNGDLALCVEERLLLHVVDDEGAANFLVAQPTATKAFGSASHTGDREPAPPIPSPTGNATTASTVAPPTAPPTATGLTVAPSTKPPQAGRPRPARSGKRKDRESDN